MKYIDPNGIFHAQQCAEEANELLKKAIAADGISPAEFAAAQSALSAAMYNLLHSISDVDDIEANNPDREMTSAQYLLKLGIDPMALGPSGKPMWQEFDAFCEQTARELDMVPVLTDEVDATPEGHPAIVVRWVDDPQ